jgi:hypothetical protein
MLLVNAVEERANVTMLTKDTIGQLHGFLGSHRILTFTQRKARSDPTYRFDAEPVRSRTQSGATRRRRTRPAYAPTPTLSTGGRCRQLAQNLREADATATVVAAWGDARSWPVG